MLELPGSVRVALWATRCLAGDLPVEQVAPRALPDVDHVAGLVPALSLWRDLGESAVLVALGGSGGLSGVPRCSPQALAAVAEAGECLVVPGVGGLLVPEHSTFGSSGRRVDWTPFDADPVPVHRVEMLSLSHLERSLQTLLAEAMADLEAAGGHPFVDSLGREIAEQRLGGAWGLPDGLPERAYRVITLAGTASAAARIGLEHSGAVTARTAADREQALRALAKGADAHLVDATNAACAAVAGWVPAR